MTVPPWSEDAEAARPYFRELRRLRDESATRFPAVTQLSMGMSNDFRVAIEEGSTCIRVGTALFGRANAARRSMSGQPLAFAHDAGDGCSLTVRVHPGARKNRRNRNP